MLNDFFPIFTEFPDTLTKFYMLFFCPWAIATIT